jgi:hypothetical protein
MSVMCHRAERLVTFDYRYNMMCPSCPGVTALTSAEYHRQDNGARVTCAHCGADIHFGQAVMTLRDTDDPVLDDHRLSAVAWYHTSTDDHWPIGTHAMPAAAVEFLTLVMPADAVDHARDRHEDQALHLGTYEAAIESMLRRMCDQDNGGAQFYLYRVALHRDGLVIKPGWRDENASDAAQITQGDLGDADGIRYLNVHESPGSISLAVRRKAIAWVQRISLPASALNVSVAPDLLTEVARIRTEIDQIETSRPTDLSPLDRLRQKAATRQGNAFERSPTPEQSALSDRIYRLIEDEYLPGISDPVRARFTHALHCWRAAQEITVNDADYVHRYASMAATLTRPSEILRLLDTQPLQAVTPTTA